VWVGINKQESQCAAWRRKGGDTHTCSQGKEGESHAKGKRGAEERQNTPLTARRTKESAQKCNRTRSEPRDSSF